MVRRRRAVLALALALVMAFSCAGCAVEGLYALPRLSDDYLQLEELIAEQIESGGEYAAPVGGANRQSVQLRDLDGDNEPEAIAFLTDETRLPTVCLYRRDGAGDFYLYVIIRGEGSAVGSVEYADLTGDGISELIIAWQIGGDLQLLSVYTLVEENIREARTELLNADCSDFLVCDLDGDGVDELLDLCVDYGGTSTLVRYEFGPEGKRSEYDARLSGGVSQVERLRVSRLTDGTPALYVESVWENGGLITDVFTAAGGFANITITASGRSNTLRDAGAYAQDINGDRALEIPETAGSVTEWYGVGPDGARTLAMTTYHCYEDGWYLKLTGPLLARRLTAAKTENVPGERAVTFSADGEGLFRIFALTGENRLDRAAADGRFLLKQNETTVYAAEFLPGGEELTEEDIINGFNLIYPEWQTGERQ